MYRECGHLINPRDVTNAPACVKEIDMPKNCAVCRRGGGLEEQLRLRNERKELEESMLESLRTGLPSIFGGSSRSTLDSVDARIEEVRKAWKSDVDDLCKAFQEALLLVFEEREGKTQW